MKYLEGQPVAEKLLNEVSKHAKTLHAKGRTPTLAVVLVGSNPASRFYIQKKQDVAKKVGIDFLLYELPEDISQNDLTQLLTALHLDNTVHGIVLQLPLPDHLRVADVSKFIAPEKDIDHFHEDSPFMPPTASAVIELLEYYKIDIKNRDIAIIGNGFLVGRPLAKILKDMGADVEVYTKATKDIATCAAKSNILVTATGQPHLIKKDFTNSQQVIIDVGSARDPKTNKLVGDVDRESIGEDIAAITPKVGGVGPVTVALLLRNTVEAAQKTL